MLALRKKRWSELSDEEQDKRMLLEQNVGHFVPKKQPKPVIIARGKAGENLADFAARLQSGPAVVNEKPELDRRLLVQSQQAVSAARDVSQAREEVQLQQQEEARCFDEMKGKDGEEVLMAKKNVVQIKRRLKEQARRTAELERGFEKAQDDASKANRRDGPDFDLQLDVAKERPDIQTQLADAGLSF